MRNVTRSLEGVLSSSLVRDNEKLKRQQEYYLRLKKEGVAKQQSYSLKPISAI